MGRKKRHQNLPLPPPKTPARKHTRKPHQDIDSTFHLPSLFFQRFQGQQSRVGGRAEGEETHRRTWIHVTCNGFTSLGSTLQCGGLETR